MNVDEIVKTNLCSGCGLCAGIVDDNKIVMKLTEGGFLRPSQQAALSEIEQSEIEATCPGLSLSQPGTADVAYDPDWGATVSLRTGFSTDSELRRLGSSGGALSGLLLYLLETGAVDFVLQVGMDPNDPVRNKLYESRSRDELLARAGSRYSPSAPLMTLRETLSHPGRFAFVGKPCDIAGLRAYVRRHPELRERIPFLISFFCAGLPSEAGTDALLDELNVERETLASFRYRGDGWPGYAKAVTRDGKVRKMNYDTSWGTILNRHLQFRCKICPDGTGEFADVVCADGWYLTENDEPDFSEKDGRSIILSRTEVGETLVEAAIASGFIKVEPLDSSLLSFMQPYQKRRKQLTLSRLGAMAFLLRPFPKYSGLHLWASASQGRIRDTLRSFAGMFVRILRGRATD